MSNPISDRRVANGKTRGSQRYATTNIERVPPIPKKDRAMNLLLLEISPPAFQYEMTVASSPSTEEGAHLSPSLLPVALSRGSQRRYSSPSEDRAGEGGGGGRESSVVVERTGGVALPWDFAR